MKKPIALAAIAVAAVLATVGIVNADRIVALVAPATSDGAAADSTVLSAPVPTQRLSIALDPTESSLPAFREDMRQVLHAIVSSHVPPRPDATRDGVPAIAGLELTIALVSTSPLAYGEGLVEVTIPGVGALAPRPDLSDDEAMQPGGTYDRWRDAEAEWTTQHDAATAAAAAGATLVADMVMTSDGTSAVTATVARLSQLVPDDAETTYVVLSDLAENEQQQPASLDGAAVLVVQPDSVGDVAHADGLFTAFEGWAVDSGATDVQRVRPELAHDAIAALIEAGAS